MSQVWRGIIADGLSRATTGDEDGSDWAATKKRLEDFAIKTVMEKPGCMKEAMGVDFGAFEPQKRKERISFGG